MCEKLRVIPGRRETSMIQELQVGQMNRALRTVSLGYMYTPLHTLDREMHTP